MRTLFDIVEGAKDGDKPSHDECYYAMLALDALLHFDHMELMNIHKAAEEGKPSLVLRASMAYSESFRRSKLAHAKPPQEWLGGQVPENPEYQRFRKIAFKVAEKATGEKLR
jgi:hypothetical protein